MFFLLWIMVCGLHFFYSMGAQKAITKVPIADLIGNSVQGQRMTKDTVTYYNNLPLCSQRPSDCGRVHQLLFNEMVTIVDQKGDEVQIKVPSVYYERDNESERYDTYWTLKKNFITCQELVKAGISLSCFPDTIEYTMKGKALLPSKKTVVLTFPFKDATTNQLFSVGTRFVVCGQTKTEYTVYVFDPGKKCMQKTVIAQSLVMVENNNEENYKKIAHFVTLLKQWAHASGTIPYVWGGCSYNQSFGASAFRMVKQKNISGKECKYYDRSDCKKSPKTGFDCTGVLVRAAQICGLPYHLKNSTTIKKNLKELTTMQHLAEGDIIWIPGHVMVVASRTHNTIVEARAYNHGFGKLQEIALGKVFNGITTFAQLEEACKKKKKLQRLDKQGAIVQYIDRYKLLDLKSIWV